MERTSMLGATRKDGVVVRDAIQTPSRVISHLKARQSAKLRELRQALVEAGAVSLDHQAAVLGLSRSTVWMVLKGHHKCSGLSPALIKRMLASPPLPSSARNVLLEYIEEKSAGAYGHSKKGQRVFRARVEPALQPPIGDVFSLIQS